MHRSSNHYCGCSFVSTCVWYGENCVSLLFSSPAVARTPAVDELSLRASDPTRRPATVSARARACLDLRADAQSGAGARARRRRGATRAGRSARELVAGRRRRAARLGRLRRHTPFFSSPWAPIQYGRTFQSRCRSVAFISRAESEPPTRCRHVAGVSSPSPFHSVRVARCPSSPLKISQPPVYDFFPLDHEETDYRKEKENHDYNCELRLCRDGRARARAGAATRCNRTWRSLWAFGLPDPIGSGSSGNEKFG
jgi:hypothetical protein